MTVSQKRAIGYAIREKEEKENIAFLKKIGKLEDFENSKYRYVKNYIKFALK